MQQTDKADTLADAIDAMLGIQPKKTAVTDPDLLDLLRVAHLRRQIAIACFALSTEEQNVLWERLASALPANE